MSLIVFYGHSIVVNMRKVIIERDTKAGQYFALFIQSLIILSLITFSMETLPGLSSETSQFLYYFEVFTIIIFSVEYLLRILLTPKPLSFIFSFYGVIDLLAILPFYLAIGIDLRSLRAFRLLRLFRLFKIMRYNSAINRFHKALTIAKEELILFLSGLVSLFI